MILYFRQAFIIASNMVLSGLWKMLYFPELILYIDGTTNHAKRGTRCQVWGAPIADVLGPHTYQVSMVQTQYVCSLHCWWTVVVTLPHWAWFCLGGRVHLMWSSEELNKNSSHVWGSLYLPMFLFRDGSTTYRNVASLMVLALVCDFLPNMEKLSNLVWWTEVLA